MSEVRIGQLWVDCDHRLAKRRRLRVIGFEHQAVLCRVEDGLPKMIGRTVRIAKDRMRPTKQGYRLVEDVKSDEEE